MTTRFHVRSDSSFIEINHNLRILKTNQRPNYFVGYFSNSDNVMTPTQFGNEMKCHHRI